MIHYDYRLQSVENNNKALIKECQNLGQQKADLQMELNEMYEKSLQCKPVQCGTTLFLVVLLKRLAMNSRGN